MKKKVAFMLCILLVVSLFVACKEGTGDSNGDLNGQFSVGYGIVDISPKESMSMGGFKNTDDRHFTIVTEALKVTCMALTDADGETVLILAYDLKNGNKVWTTPTREAISEATGVPFDKIMLTMSHTHSAPDITIYPVYQEEVKKHSVEAAMQALADRAPATLLGSYTRIEEKVNCSRHYLLADGTYMAENVGAVPKDQLIGHFSKADNLLQVVKFEREEKKDIVLMNWQAHYLGASCDPYACTSDYPGVMRATVEKVLDCYSIFFQGAAGNLNSSSQIPNEMAFQLHTELGEFLGNKVIDMSQSLQPMNIQELQITEVMQPCRSVTAKGNLVEIPLYTLSIGDLAMVFAPNELFDTTGMAIRDNSPFPMTMIACLSNQTNGYLPTPPSWDWEEKYEVRVTLFEKGTAEEVEQKFIEMLTEQFNTAGYTQVEKGEGYITPEYVPVTDGITYINPAAGDTTAYTEVANGFYQLHLLNGSSLKTMLTRDPALAEQILTTETVKLIFDESNVIVGIAS